MTPLYSEPHENHRVAEKRFRCWLAVFVVFAAVAVYLPSLDNNPVYDDVFLIVRDARVNTQGEWKRIWQSDYWPGARPSFTYRPLTTTSYAAVARMGGPGVTLQRVVNLALHAGCSLAVFFLAGVLGLSSRASLVAGLLFALHPIHSEAVYLIVGRGELLAALLGLIFIWGVLAEWNPALLGLVLGAALLSKENAIMVPALGFVLYGFKFCEKQIKALQRSAVRLLAIALPAVGGLFILRYQVFGTFFSPKGYVDPLYNSLADIQGPFRLVNALWVQVLYLKAMLWPFPLRADYSFNQVELIGSLLDIRVAVLAGLIFAVLGLAIYRGRRWRLEIGGMIFFFLALFPVSNLIVTVGITFGERLAYLPSVGFCLAAGSLIDRWESFVPPGKWQYKMVLFAMMVLLAIGAAGIVQRDGAWQDNDAFTVALVKDAPMSAHAHGLRFLELKKHNRRRAAEKHLRRALEIYPAYYDAWDSYGDFLLEEARYEGAAYAFTKAAEAVARRPYDADEAGTFLIKAAEVQLKLGDCSNALINLEKAKRWKPETHPKIRMLENRIKSSGCHQ
jgi:tetratricopeptide (TPR) repeat protein